MGNNEHLYQVIYNYIVDGIKKKNYRKGDQLPTEKQLADKFDVSRITSKKALEMLAEEGIIKRIRGKGSFIVKEFDEEVLPQDYTRNTHRNIIGVVLPDYSDGYATEILKGLEEEALQHDLLVVHRRSFGQQKEEEKAINSLLELGVIGLIVMPVHGAHYSTKILELVINKFPIVFIDRYLKGIKAPFVGTDNIAASKMAVDYLINLGHRNIGYISPPSVDTSTIEDRIEGFIKSHIEHGIPFLEENNLANIRSTIPGYNTSDNIKDDIKNIKKHLQEHTHITCLFATEYNIALLCREAIQSLDKKIPEDIAILCFDAPRNFLDQYVFTHIRQQENKMGRIAIDLIRQQINNKNVSDKIFLEGQIIIGETTDKRKG